MQDGYVHVMLRQLPSTSDTPPGKVRIELSVIDTGKVRTACGIPRRNSVVLTPDVPPFPLLQGISQHFLKVGRFLACA